MILLLGGTRDAREILEKLSLKGQRVTYTAATDYGAYLSEPAGGGDIQVGSGILSGLSEKSGVSLIVDATHPYADGISAKAMESARGAGIPYIRFEREGVINENTLEEFDALAFSDQREAADFLKATEGIIFLTTGSSQLERWDAIDRERLAVRVLPTVKALEKCGDCGLRPNQIIAAQGPFSVSENIWMFRRFKADYVVLKDSGDVGGTAEKLAAAKETGATPVIILRPCLPYPKVFSDTDELVGEAVRLMEAEG